MKVLFITGMLMICAIIYSYQPSSFPREIVFLGHTLSSWQNNNNSQEKELDIISYRSQTQQRVLLFAKRNNSKVSTDHLLQQYLGRFQFQGFTFTEDEKRRLGQRQDERLYLTASKTFDGIVVYIEKGANKHSSATNNLTKTFSAMEKYDFRKRKTFGLF